MRPVDYTVIEFKLFKTAVFAEEESAAVRDASAVAAASATALSVAEDALHKAAEAVRVRQNEGRGWGGCQCAGGGGARAGRRLQAGDAAHTW